MHRADQATRRRIILLHDDTRESMPSGAKIPLHVAEPLSAVVIVKKGRIEADRIQFHRVRPRPFDSLGRDEKHMGILEGPAHAGRHDIGVDQPKFSVRMAERRSPRAGGTTHPAQVELRATRERVAHRPPVSKVTRVVQHHAGKPLEGGGRQVVIFAHPADRRVRTKAREDWIAEKVGLRGAGRRHAMRSMQSRLRQCTRQSPERFPC
jgi:hypothetical protein